MIDENRSKRTEIDKIVHIWPMAKIAYLLELPKLDFYYFFHLDSYGYFSDLQ